jgi:U3 small nucleolar RNA-associated protein 18
MPRQRSKKLSESLKGSQKSIPPNESNIEQNNTDNDDESFLEKDEEEEELDKLVLGDAADFKSQLRLLDSTNSSGESGDDSIEGESGEEAGLEHIDDADVNTPPSFSKPD